MKKRIINNHTMKVFVTPFDLKQNGITALDLLGDHNQIERFFHKILNKVDTEHLFAPKVPLTFRVLPRKKGLDIIISRHITPKPLRKINRGQTLRPVNRTLKDSFIKLNSFESFVQISRILKINDGDTSLYHYQSAYYLELKFNGMITRSRADKIKDDLAITYEYGGLAPIPGSMIRAHGKVIMKNHALEKGRYYFNK